MINSKKVLDDTGHFSNVPASAIPAATTSAAGGVKKTPAVTDIATQTVSGADAAAVATSATTAVNAVGTKLNALLAQLRAAGIVTP